MIKYLLHRPIAVFMTFTAFFILGIITYLNIPVSLLPDIAIPEISVHITAKDYSARELENTVTASIRQQLLQVGKLTDIHSETRDGSSIIRLAFEYGVDTELAFIEVNEKIDAAMGYLPREVNRPRVVKASATDIPVFNLNLTLKDETAAETDFLNLCEFAETVIRRRMEQLPQVAMVDMTGLIRKQVIVSPDMNLLKITGISLSDIESALSNNNIEPGNMTVREGHYEYNIKFSAVMRTIEDMQNIYIRKNDKIYHLKDLAEVKLISEPETGIVLFNDKQAVSLAIIKQVGENMDDLKKELGSAITKLEESHPQIEFTISQNQTELLDYTISNLKQNLLLAFIFICLVSAFFMRDIKSPLIIGMSMFVSLIISLLFFYLFGVSLNVISLTGLILALGMMIDNSIIVTDNIGQYRQKGLSIDDSCIKGTNEVIAPMLSSSLTTISVFVPLIFLSGIAGALFFDQAFSVAVGLMVSYVTGIILLPVLYKLVYSIKGNKIKIGNKKSENKEKKSDTLHTERNNSVSLHERMYHACIEWIFSHKMLTVVVMLAVFPLCFGLFTIIGKEKMPEISQNEMIVKVEWNEGIHVDENRERISRILTIVREEILESSALIGPQQFLLNKNQEQAPSEAEIYLKVTDMQAITKMKSTLTNLFSETYPQAIISFAPATNIFEQIFDTGAPELVVQYYARNRDNSITSEMILSMKEELTERTGETPSVISFQEQINLRIDKDKMVLYGASYDDIYKAVKTGFKANHFSVLRSYQQYLPIILGDGEKTFDEIINQTMIYTTTDDNGKRNSVPLSTFVNVSTSKDTKSIIAGKNGEYIPFYFYETSQPEQVMQSVRESVIAGKDWDVNFSGTFFSNRKMLSELFVILLISILLMYFILAAQFESFLQLFIVLLEIPIDIAAALGLLILTGHTLNLMSAIGIIVTCGIIINDSILKVDIMNQLRKTGMPLMDAIHEAGKRRLNAILMTSFTSIVCMTPLLFSHDIGSELEKPLAIGTIGGMLIGTPVSLFVVPLVYWWIYRKQNIKEDNL